jgi:hypothetical protein
MDVLDNDLGEFWKALINNDVQFIMVGGFASVLHGVSRMTQDLDIWIKDTRPNRINLRKAISDYGLGDFEQLENMRFVAGWTTIFLAPGLELDIMTELKAFPQEEFDECLSIAYKADLMGNIVPFLHINNLIIEKKACSRPKDLLDVDELEKIIKLS